MPGCDFDGRSVSPSAMLHGVNSHATCCLGAVYSAEEMLVVRGDSVRGKVAAVSFFSEAPNRLCQLVPGAARWQEMIRIID